MRFNHVELTVPPGTLTPEFRANLDAFYGSIFGWSSPPRDNVPGRREITPEMSPLASKPTHLLMPDPHFEQLILLVESETPMSAPGDDHLGVLYDTRQEVNELLDACKSYAEGDPAVEIRECTDVVLPMLTTHAFFVKYQLPIFLDVQCMERPSGWRSSRP